MGAEVFYYWQLIGRSMHLQNHVLEVCTVWSLGLCPDPFKGYFIVGAFLGSMCGDMLKSE